MPKVQVEEHPQFVLRTIYCKDISFEAFGLPDILGKPLNPSVTMDIDTHHVEKSSHHHEVTLDLTIKAEESQKNLFIVEVEMAALFQIQGVTGKAIAELLNIVCPETMFPYLRETIDYLVVKSNFPALRLPPVYFESIYRNKIRQAKRAGPTT